MGQNRRPPVHEEVVLLRLRLEEYDRFDLLLFLFLWRVYDELLLLILCFFIFFLSFFFFSSLFLSFFFFVWSVSLIFSSSFSSSGGFSSTPSSFCGSLVAGLVPELVAWSSLASPMTATSSCQASNSIIVSWQENCAWCMQQCKNYALNANFVWLLEWKIHGKYFLLGVSIKLNIPQNATNTSHPSTYSPKNVNLIYTSHHESLNKKNFYSQQCYQRSCRR